MEHLVVPTFVLDAECRVIIWNRACERLTGVPAAELIGSREHWRAAIGRCRGLAFEPQHRPSQGDAGEELVARPEPDPRQTQRTGPGYRLSNGSAVRSVTLSTCAWATSNRSNGSLCRGGRPSTARTCSPQTGSSK